MSTIVQATELEKYIGQETGVSDWFYIDQNRINDFADVTEDHQYIHTDVEKAKNSPFSTTIAHGFLSLSMLSHICEKAFLTVDKATAGINYGFDRVRFMSPVKVDSKIRARTTLAEVTDKGHGRYLMKYSITVEIEGEKTPAFFAEWLVMAIL